MSQQLLTYGIDKETGELRYIKDALSGLKCNCKCPKCGGDLEAHKGLKKIHHFHHHHSVTNCYGAFESQVHLLSKAIIEEKKMLMLPQYNGCYSVVYPPRKQGFSEVINECSQIDLKPDCLCKYQDEQGNEQTIWVEIFYSHAVDEEKTRKIRERKITCVEIDVRPLFKNAEVIDKDVLADFLLNSPENRHWINNPNGDRLLIEANRIRQQESIIPVWKEYSVDVTRFREFKTLIYLMFVRNSRIGRGDYKELYEFIKENRPDCGALDPIPLRLFVSALQILLCHLIVIGKFNPDKRYSKQQQIAILCRDLNDLLQQLSYWADLALRIGASQLVPQHRSVVLRRVRYGGGRRF